jgi:hypothetical protein
MANRVLVLILMALLLLANLAPDALNLMAMEVLLAQLNTMVILIIKVEQKSIYNLVL